MMNIYVAKFIFFNISSLALKLHGNTKLLIWNMLNKNCFMYDIVSTLSTKTIILL